MARQAARILHLLRQPPLATTFCRHATNSQHLNCSTSHSFPPSSHSDYFPTLGQARRTLHGSSKAVSDDVSPRPRYAIVRSVPDSFGSAVTMEPLKSPIDVDRAREQHANYVTILRGLVGEVIQLEADEAHPDCPFVEDTAVVVGSRALITRIGNETRRGEEVAMARVLRDIGLDVIHMDPPAHLDGGDVLQLDHHLFVGISSRTNSEGISSLAAAFPETRVIPIPIHGSGGLHLKSVMTWVGKNILLMEGNQPTMDAYVEVMKVERMAAMGLKAFHVEEAGAANTCYINGNVLYPFALCGEKTSELVRLGGATAIPVDISEFHKADGGLTCLSVIVS